MSELPAGTVTFVFTDIEGSTELTRALGDRWPEVHAEHRRRVRTSFGESGGREVDAQGDSFFFVFARARQALTAAAAAQRVLREPWPDGTDVAVRMGVHTGEPSLGDEGYLGLDVVRGARISALARGGEVLVSETTRALVRGDDLGGLELEDLGERSLKGIEEPERVYRLVVPGVPLPAPREEAAPEPSFPTAGRELELAAKALGALDLGRLEGLETRIEQDVDAMLRAAGIQSTPPPPPSGHPDWLLPAVAAAVAVVAGVLVWVLLLSL